MWYDIVKYQADIMNIDRDNRDRLVETIKQFLNEEMMAFDFRDAICNIYSKSKDPAILYAIDTLWYFYDDSKDHKVALEKVQWDFINRLMLLLKSDARITIDKNSKWHFTQLVAAVSLLLFCLCTAVLGFGEHLFIVAIPFGIISFVIAKIRNKSKPELSKNELALTPFKSRSEILTLRRKLPYFKKMKYSSTIENRPFRSDFYMKFLNFYWRIIWLMLSPLVLIYQSFPDKNEVIHIRPSTS